MAPAVKPWTLERIREHVTITEDGCWLWQRSARRDGYGQVRIADRCVAVHRLAYVLRYGPLDAETHLHHTCETRRCVNPRHLRALTQADHNRLHLTKTHCKHGHPLVPGNLCVYKSGPKAGKRFCRECHRAAGRRRYLRRKAAA